MSHNKLELTAQILSSSLNFLGLLELTKTKILIFFDNHFVRFTKDYYTDIF